MKNKYYNLTKKPNEGVRDEMPKWMNDVLSFKPSDGKKGNPFEGIDDPILNPKTRSVKTCTICGLPLAENEVITCTKCQ